jgi:hypothetical protein
MRHFLLAFILFPTLAYAQGDFSPFIQTDSLKYEYSVGSFETLEYKSKQYYTVKFRIERYKTKSKESYIVRFGLTQPECANKKGEILFFTENGNVMGSSKFNFKDYAAVSMIAKTLCLAGYEYTENLKNTSI